MYLNFCVIKIARNELSLTTILKDAASYKPHISPVLTISSPYGWLFLGVIIFISPRQFRRWTAGTGADMNLGWTSCSKFKCNSKQIGLRFIDLLPRFEHSICKLIDGSFTFSKTVPDGVEPVNGLWVVIFLIADLGPNVQTWIVIIRDKEVNKFCPGW